jgi:hypothetical protein
MRKTALILAVVTPLLVGGQVLAKHATHPVTPENIDKQPFAFTVQINDVVIQEQKKDKIEFKEFTITVVQKAGKRAPASTATGSLTIVGTSRNRGYSPACHQSRIERSADLQISTPANGSRQSDVHLYGNTPGCEDSIPVPRRLLDL